MVNFGFAESCIHKITTFVNKLDDVSGGWGLKSDSSTRALCFIVAVHLARAPFACVLQAICSHRRVQGVINMGWGSKIPTESLFILSS